MQILHFLPVFLMVALASASPLPQQELEAVQGYWIIEAIAEGDLEKAVDIIEEHIQQLIETGRNVSAMWDQIVEKILEKLGVSDLDDHVKEKIRTILGKIQARIDEIQKSHEETKEKYPFALAEKYSLIEDIKEVINQIKHQGGSIIASVGNIKDIISAIIG